MGEPNEITFPFLLPVKVERPLTVKASEIALLLLRDAETLMRDAGVELRRIGCELFTQETGVAVGTDIVWHRYKASWNSTPEDRTCRVVGIAMSAYGTRPIITVSPCTAAGKPGTARKSLGNAQWSKAPDVGK